MPVRWVALTGAVLAGLIAQEAPPKPPAAARKAFQSAEKAQQKNRTAQARRSYEAAVSLYPDYEEAWCGLGLLQAEQGEYSAALYPVLLEFPTGNPVLAGMPAGTPVSTRYMLDHASPSMQHFSDLGPETGGQRFTRIGATDSVLPDILKSLAQQVLRYTYVAGYYPDPSDKGKRHEAQVVLLNRNKGALSGGGRIVDH